GGKGKGGAAVVGFAVENQQDVLPGEFARKHLEEDLEACRIRGRHDQIDAGDMTNKRNNSHGGARAATPRFFTISDIADFFAVSRRSVRRWIKSGDLPVHRVRGVVRISDSDLRTFAATPRL